jgi:hypothetical protein
MAAASCQTINAGDWILQAVLSSADHRREIDGDESTTTTQDH